MPHGVWPMARLGPRRLSTAFVLPLGVWSSLGVGRCVRLKKRGWGKYYNGRDMLKSKCGEWEKVIVWLFPVHVPVDDDRMEEVTDRSAGRGLRTVSAIVLSVPRRAHGALSRALLLALFQGAPWRVGEAHAAP